MSRDEVIQKIREIAKKDKNLAGAEIEISFRDKKSNKITKEIIKIQEG